MFDLERRDKVDDLRKSRLSDPTHDVRCSTQSVVVAYEGHSQEVCGLKLDEEGRALASGGNDDLFCIWDATADQV